MQYTVFNLLQLIMFVVKFYFYNHSGLQAFLNPERIILHVSVSSDMNHFLIRIKSGVKALGGVIMPSWTWPDFISLFLSSLFYGRLSDQVSYCSFCPHKHSTVPISDMDLDTTQTHIICSRLQIQTNSSAEPQAHITVTKHLNHNAK